MYCKYLAVFVLFFTFAAAASAPKAIDSDKEARILRSKIQDMEKFINFGRPVNEKSIHALDAVNSLDALRETRNQTFSKAMHLYCRLTRPYVQDEAEPVVDADEDQATAADKAHLNVIVTSISAIQAEQAEKFLLYFMEHVQTDATIKDFEEILGKEGSTPEHIGMLQRALTELQSRAKVVEKFTPGLLKSFYERLKKEKAIVMERQQDVYLKRAIVFLYKTEDLQEVIQVTLDQIDTAVKLYCFINTCQVMPEDELAKLKAKTVDELDPQVNKLANDALNYYWRDFTGFERRIVADAFRGSSPDVVASFLHYLQEHLFTDISIDECKTILGEEASTEEHIAALSDFIAKAQVVAQFSKKRMEEFAIFYTKDDADLYKTRVRLCADSYLPLQELQKILLRDALMSWVYNAVWVVLVLGLIFGIYWYLKQRQLKNQEELDSQAV